MDASDEEVESDDAPEHEEDRRPKSKSKKGKQSKGDSLLFQRIECNAHRINAEFIPSCYSMLGADLHEGGLAKKGRDALYLSLLSALDIPGVRSNPPTSSTEGMGDRLRLAKAGMQTADQVCAPTQRRSLSISRLASLILRLKSLAARTVDHSSGPQQFAFGSSPWRQRRA